MRLKPECVPCMLRMALQTARLSSNSGEVHRKVMEGALRILGSTGWDLTPPEAAIRLHREIRRITGVMDPFAGLKKRSNEAAARLLQKMREIVEGSGDRLETAVRLAAAGNVMDFAAFDSPDLESAINEALTRPFAIYDYPIFRRRVKFSETFLYFLDNAGEIYSDRLLIEEMIRARGEAFKKISLVVKGGPIINDATMEDALKAGLHLLPNTRFLQVSNGEDGSGPEPRSSEIDGWIGGHELVLAKGQGNYEVLEEKGGVFFLLMAKCGPVAESLGVNVGDFVFRYSP